MDIAKASVQSIFGEFDSPRHQQVSPSGLRVSTSERRGDNWKVFKIFYLKAKAGFSQGQNLALTVFYVP